MKRYNSIQEIKTEVVKLLNERRALINVDQDKFKPNTVEKGERLTVTVTYDGITIMTVMPFISNVMVKGQHQARGMLSVRALDDDYWYDNEDLDAVIFVDEYLRCQFQKKLMTFDKLLDILLPLEDTDKIKRIREELEKISFKNAKVKFDTYTFKYVVEGDIHSFLCQKNSIVYTGGIQKKRFFKYMFFDTYVKILKSKKIRMNSIVSMNDSSEMFYLGDYLCNAYEDERRKLLYPQLRYFHEDCMRNNKLVKYKNNLIGCFSEKEDDALMWRLYGDDGKGVCVEFEIENDSLKPVLYLDEKNQNAKLLKELAERMKNNGITLSYKDLSKYHFYTKSQQFGYEGEWRIVRYASDEELEVANYDGLISLYKDYSFEELGLKPTNVYLGANIAYKDVNVPLLVDLSKRELKVKHVKKSVVESLRV